MSVQPSRHALRVCLLAVLGGLLLAAGWMLSALGPPVTASPAVANYGPCPVADFATYRMTITAAGGCTIDDKLFSNFAGIEVYGVSPVTTPEIGLQFGPPAGFSAITRVGFGFTPCTNPTGCSGVNSEVDTVTY